MGAFGPMPRREALVHVTYNMLKKAFQNLKILENHRKPSTALEYHRKPLTTLEYNTIETLEAFGPVPRREALVEQDGEGKDDLRGQQGVQQRGGHDAAHVRAAHRAEGREHGPGAQPLAARGPRRLGEVPGRDDVRGQRPPQGGQEGEDEPYIT